MRDAIKFLSFLALCVLPLSACADASDADTLRKLTAFAEQGSAAAEAGYSLAQGDVGNIYGKRSDWPQAVKWWAAAAEQGYAPAAYNLANAYQNGQGVPKDSVQALAQILIMQRQMPEPMRPRFAPRLEAIRSTLSPEQIAQAEVAAAAWQARPTPLTLRAQRGAREARELVN